MTAPVERDAYGRLAVSASTVSPGVWRMLLERNEYFTGRRKLLDELRGLLLAKRRVALVDRRTRGGGSGKTQVAVEYAYRFAHEYQMVWSVDAASSAMCAATYAQLAAALGLPEATSDSQQEMIGAVRSWLGRHGDWLLIFDEVPKANDLSRFVPEECSGHVLVTGRVPKGPTAFGSLGIGPFEQPETVEFLARRSGLPPDDAAASVLARRLGDVPLVLNLAGAYAAATGTALPDCVKAFDEHIPKRDDAHRPETPDVRRAARMVLLPALRQMAKENAVASDLLALCAFLASGNIAFSLIRNGRPFLPRRLSAAVAEGGELTRAIDTLCRYGLAQRGGDAMYVHAVIQEATRESIPEDRRRDWAAIALRVVADAFPTEAEYGHVIPACSRLLGHTFMAAGHAEKLGTAAEDAGLLLNRAGRYLRGCVELEDARRCCRHAVALAEAAYGAHHPVVAARINDLGVVYQDQGDLKEARACYERALAVGQVVYGQYHETFTMPARNLCNVADVLGDPEVARQTYKRALDIYLKVYGWNHSIVAECLNRLGQITHHQGQLSSARDWFESAVLAEQSAEATDRAKLAVYVTNLGIAQLDSGNAPEAQHWFAKALELDRAEHGADDPSVGRDLANLGRALREQRCYAEARECLTQALAICEASEGPNTPDVARVLAQLGKVTWALGDASGTCSYFERLLAVDEVLHGSQAPEVANDLADLGRALEKLADYAEAQGCFERALAILETAHGPHDSTLPIALNGVGRALQAQGRLSDALGHFQRALAIDTTVKGENDPAVARDAHSLGRVLTELGDAPRAVGYFMQALKIYEASLGATHPKTRKVRDELESLGD